VRDVIAVSAAVQ